MFTEMTEDVLGDMIAQHPKVMVQYGAAWCGNCKITKPKFKRMAEENPGVEFYYVDAEKLPNSRQYADVSNLPTFAGFVNGQLVGQTQGNRVENIQTLVNEVANH
jgi:thiol-disulfide isomerase/thioredoxin